MSGIIFSQASGLNDSVFGKSQEPIKSMITAGVESFEETSLLDKIFYMDKTKNFAEKYATHDIPGELSGCWRERRDTTGQLSGGLLQGD